MSKIHITGLVSAVWMVLMVFYYTAYDPTSPLSSDSLKPLAGHDEEFIPDNKNDALSSGTVKHAVKNSEIISSLRFPEDEYNSESNYIFHINRATAESTESSSSKSEFGNGLHDLRKESSNRICSQSSRLRLLRSTCKAKYNKKITSVAPENFARINAYVDEKHKIFACLPPKSGCTTWKTILANNSFSEPFQYKNVMNIHSLAREGEIPGAVPFRRLSPAKRDRILKSKEYFRFMVARHPFERIYSAYKDKIVEGSSPAMKIHHAREILEMFRTNITNEQWKKGDSVTFKEFVRYLKIRRTTNRHFLPVEDDCRPCLINYDYIVKTETMNEDNEYIIDHFLGPTKRGMGTAKHVVANKPEADDRPVLSPKGRLLEAYQTLTAEDVAFLAERFGGDLLHFGYDWRVENSTGNAAAVYSLCTAGGQGEGINACC